MNILAGNCSKCGAPFYVPTIIYCILPPQPIPTCGCWNIPQIKTTTGVKYILVDDFGNEIKYEKRSVKK